MSIQQSINQGLSLAGLLFSQTPYAATKKEERVSAAREAAEKEKYQKQYQQYEEYARREGVAKEPETEGELAGQLVLSRMGEQAARRLFELDPTQESITRFEREAAGLTELERLRGTLPATQIEANAQRRRKADEAARASQQAEQERLARSRQFAEMVTAGVTPSYGRREGGR